MRKTNNILYIAATLLAAACSVKENPDDTLQPGGKTPLVLNATLSSGSAVTKATGKDFEENDVLLAYIRHLDNSNNPVNADKAPLLVAFKKGSADMEATTGDENIRKTADLTSVSPTDNTAAVPLYWDDFSNSANANTDLRTDDHGLQSFYGYCYNGGTPSTALTNANGTLGWTLPTSYANATAVKNADLLWSRAQPKVVYGHSTARNGSRDGLTIPYTHAMSEITVTLNAVEGFSGAPLGSTVLTLNAMNTVASLTAPTAVVTSNTTANITMFAETYASGLTRNFTAIVAPGTKLKVGERLLNITNVEDNDYTLNITDAMVKKDGDSDDSNNLAWAKDHEVQTEEKDYILTKPGYNYHLDITVNKTRIVVEATITDWTSVNATGTGIITYPEIAFTLTGDKFANNAAIYIYQLLAEGTNNDEATERTNYGSPVTTATYNSSTDKWTNNPLIYWPNQTNRYYFRALSPNTTTVEQGTIAEGKDVLWGITPAHGTFAQGEAIGPRTNEVPLAFEHALSKITVTLETAEGGVSSTSPAVDLTGATISLSHLSTGGTINIEDGNITTNAIVEAAISGLTSDQEYIVIPQTIGNDTKLTVTLADGTKYSLQLNTCVQTGGTTPIGTWERGKHYTYTIHLEKEQMTFRALVKDWEEKSGSGNANLEWD